MARCDVLVSADWAESNLHARALSAAGNGDAVVQPSGAGIHEVDVKIT